MKTNQNPYIIRTKRKITRTYHYNPNYGDDKLCKCGHPYYRHFDTYEKMYPIGCKYCVCRTFSAASTEQGY